MLHRDYAVHYYDVHAFIFLTQPSVVQAAPMEVLVLLQTLVPVFHNGLEPRVPVVS